ncbi:MAG: ion transporter [Gemmatimonadota bacterium]|nr:ion transporter [Gemmatimonadota bacterium]
MTDTQRDPRSARERLRVVIFDHDTPLGRAFDVGLIWLIVASVLVVLLESVADYRLAYGAWFRAAEWAFTIAFTVEYGLRLWSATSARAYAGSFFGIVDLVAILPTYLSLFLPGGQALLAVRAIRLLRVFRVLKLATYVSEAALLMRALRASRQKITVFLVGVVTLVITVGALMYLVEGAEHGFTSIPRSIYWAIVTLTTVGYGDVAPQTTLGQMLASLVMILGYGIIAVPTGIVTVEISAAARQAAGRRCPTCTVDGHAGDARFCRVCGAGLA